MIFDFRQLFWSMSYVSLLLMMYLLIAHVLYTRRQVAPRACMRGVHVMLVLFFSHFVLVEFDSWIYFELSIQTIKSPATASILFKIYNIFYSCFHALGLGLLIWCVMMDRQPASTPTE